MLTGFYKDSVITEKLKAVDNSTITSKQGVLTWEDVKNLNNETVDANYIIEFVGSTLNDLTIENNTEFDFADFDDVKFAHGKYVIKITPKYSSYFTGNTSGEFVVYKLPPVGAITNPEIDNVNNVLQWNSVSATDDNNNKIYAEKYEIEIYDTETEELLLRDSKVNEV